MSEARRMSPAEYLAWEREQLDKHEFHEGEIVEWAGHEVQHCRLAAAVLCELHRVARERGCHALSSQQRIAAEPRRRYLYADAVVVCGPMQTEPEARDVLINPTVVVEVLLPSTEAYDRGVKWQAYQRLPSLTNYLLIAQAEARIEHFIRSSDGSWSYRVYIAGDTITLANQAQLAIDAIYDGVFELEAG